MVNLSIYCNKEEKAKAFPFSIVSRVKLGFLFSLIYVIFHFNYLVSLHSLFFAAIYIMVSTEISVQVSQIRSDTYKFIIIALIFSQVHRVHFTTKACAIEMHHVYVTRGNWRLQHNPFDTLYIEDLYD